jgi:amino acid adenylation domain-containing protein
MKDLFNRINNLSPDKRDLFFETLKKAGIDIPKMDQALLQPAAGVSRPLPADRETPATAVQKRMYSISQAYPQSTAYNITNAWKISGLPERPVLEDIFYRLIERHEALRTSFRMKDEELMQVLHDPYPAPIRYKHVAGEEELRQAIADAIHPFECERLPLFTIVVISLPEDEQILLYNFSHIIADGISLNILLREFVQMLRGESLSEPVLQPRDIHRWQSGSWSGGLMREAEAFWMDQFQGKFSVLQLPVDFHEYKHDDFCGEEIGFGLDAGLSDMIRNVSARYDCSVFSVLLSAMSILLGRITQQQEVTIAVPFAGRRGQESANVVGMFVNTVALCTRPLPEKSAGALIRELSAVLLQAQTYQDYPFEELLGRLDMESNDGSPALRVLINSQNANAATSLSGLAATPFPVSRQTTTFDLAFFPSEGQTIKFTCSYRKRLFRRETIELIINAYQELLSLMVRDPDLMLREYRILIPSWESGNRLGMTEKTGKDDLPVPRTILSLTAAFDKMVAAFPFKPAMVHGQEFITYAELDRRACELAWQLRERMKDLADNGRMAHVALLFDQGIGMVTGILAALKGGFPFVPLDPSFPFDRLRYMVEDFGVSVIVTDIRNGSLSGELLEGQPVIVREDGRQEKRVLADPPADAIAFVLYTSGSSGVPKGVLQTHRAVAFYIDTCINELKIQSDDRLAFFSSYSHAVGILDILSVLLSGASLYIYALREEFQQIPGWLVRDRISIYHSVPTVFRQLLSDDSSLTRYPGIRLIILGGEEVRISDFELFCRFFGDGDSQFVNFFGATEVMVVSFHFLSKGSRQERSTIPIAPPVEGVRIQMRDAQGYDTGVFSTGEMVYVTEFMTRGYCNLQLTTHEAFSRWPGSVAGRADFASGDLGRLLPDGNIEYLGRKDLQVKLRGLRIDLSEIEVCLLKYPGVKAAVAEVLRYRDHDGEYLHVFYVAGIVLSQQELTAHLARLLPAYMVPTRLTRLESMPLTSTGKTDRKMLAVAAAGDAVVSLPRGRREMVLAILFRKVLKMPAGKEIDIDDNFFSLGGHSLRASLLISLIQKELGVHVNIQDIFAFPNVRTLAAKIGITGNKVFSGITGDKAFSGIAPVERRNYYSLSSAQKRIYINHYLNETGIGYNLPVFFVINGSLETERLEKAVAQLIRRHESLRTCFIRIKNEPFQMVLDEVSFSVEYHDLSPAGNETELARVINSFTRSFDLSRAPLMRIGVISLSATHHILLTDVHHIIADGTSTEIMIGDVATFYSGEVPAPLSLQYKDYAFWHNQRVREGKLREQEIFWLERFSGKVHPLTIPTGRQRPAVFTGEGGRYECRLGIQRNEMSASLCRMAGCTPFMLHLAVLNVLLFKFSGEKDILIGSPSFGRNIPDVDNIIGLFVNPLVFRNTVDEKNSFSRWLDDVRNNCIEVYDNQDYPFDDLVKKLDLRRDVSRNPLFDVCMAFQNYNTASGRIEGLGFEPLRYHNGTAKFDLLFTLYEIEMDTLLTVEYYSAVFDQDFIVRMTECYLSILQQVALRPDITIKEIRLTDRHYEEDPFFPEMDFQIN